MKVSITRTTYKLPVQRRCERWEMRDETGWEHAPRRVVAGTGRQLAGGLQRRWKDVR